MIYKKKIFCFLALPFSLVLFSTNLFAGTIFNYREVNKLQLIGRNCDVFIDSSGKLNVQDVAKMGLFSPNNSAIPNFPVSSNSIWLRFSIHNSSSLNEIFLVVTYPNTSELELFKDSAKSFILCGKAGNGGESFINTTYNPDYSFHLSIMPRDTGIYYLKIKSLHQVLLPVFSGSESDFQEASIIQTIIVGLYAGIILAVFLYNVFVFFSTKDTSYLYYIIYIAFLGIAQITLSGHGYLYIWPKMAGFNKYAVPFTSSIAGASAIVFTNVFLNTKYYTPVIRKIFNAIGAAFVIAAITTFLNRNDISYNILNFASLAAGLFAVFTSLYIARKGYRPAYFYFVSWTAFSVGLVIFVLSNLNILPINNFTNYILYLGSAIEAILLSIALADKINVYKLEKETSQAEALRVAKENEILIREQNIVLEQQVAERTKELRESNHQLNDAIINLKDAQAQLVQAEKMASLGQLTAGIAHEINNPINFVKSNINPLRLDINDIFELIDNYNSLHKVSDNNEIRNNLKKINNFQEEIDLSFVRTEISNLIKGIEDGAERTAEIVRGLRTFSRLDEGAIKTVNLHDGVESTLVLLKNSIPYNIKIRKNFKAEGEVECYPGKINQVFMNVLNNGIQAITAKKPMGEEEFIDITTWDSKDGFFHISIKDSGIGMSEETKQHVFEPFFTTKEVGEGTGLGMAIVFKIIEQHGGSIEINSQLGVGTEFILILPHKYPDTEQTN